MSRGVLMFAFNNDQIDYVRMAVNNAAQIRHHMGVDVTMVTDVPGEYPDIDVILVDYQGKPNTRTYRDTVYRTAKLDFRNINRADAHDLTPYDETILLDADLLVLGDTLNKCWGSVEPLMINHTYQDVYAGRKMPELQRLNPLGIDQVWATQMYFQKSPEAQVFFELCKHVRDNYAHYKQLYRWPHNMFRNDYVFSVAAHMYTGHTGESLPDMPVQLYNTFDVDSVHSVPDRDRVIMYLERREYTSHYVLSDWQHNNIHIMNKWALGKVCDQLEDMT